MTTFILKEDNARDRMAAAWKFACSFLELGKPCKVTIDEAKPSRTLDQNALFHALCGDLAAQKQWAGQRIDTEGWKRLLVDAWARAENKSPGHIVPSLDGQSVVALGIQTRRLKVVEMAELIEFTYSYCAENGVVTYESRRAA